MKKMFVACLVLGLSAGALMAAPQPPAAPAAKADDKCCGTTVKPVAEMDLAKMETALKDAEKKGDAKAVACIKKCIDAKKALDAAVKSGDKAAIAKAQESCKKVMDENKAVCPAAPAKK